VKIGNLRRWTVLGGGYDEIVVVRGPEERQRQQRRTLVKSLGSGIWGQGGRVQGEG